MKSITATGTRSWRLIDALDKGCNSLATDERFKPRTPPQRKKKERKKEKKKNRIIKDRITPHAHFFSEWFSGSHAIMTE